MSDAGVALSLIVAMDRARAIGRDGELPWHLPNDLKRFKFLTMGKPIIMGRRTHASIGRPLPGRRNIVLTQSNDYLAPGCDCFDSLQGALASLAAGTEAMIIGGAALYREALPHASRIYLTEVDATVDGDVHFPLMSEGEWREVSTESHVADDKHAFGYCFRILQRVTRMPLAVPNAH